MNLSRSEKEDVPQTPWVFISIFYAREKWHELLPVIYEALTDRRNDQLRPQHYFVFFSSHRGSSIRLALKYEHAHKKQAYGEILNPIVAYMEQHPSFMQRLQLPISSFFLDFPSNSIQYNLYSESSIAPGGLSQFQTLLSQIMLQFFEDHPVDHEGMFTLTVWLQNAILNGLSNLELGKQELIEQIMAELNSTRNAHELKPYQLEETPLCEELQPFIEQCDLENLFLEIELLTVLMNDRLQDPIRVYLLFLRLMREHLLKLPNEVVLQSLQYLNSSVSVGDSFLSR